MRSSVQKVAVFLDYENVHRVGHGLYTSYGAEKHSTVVDPVKIAERLVAKRRHPSELTQIKVYRGRPVPEHQAKAASANDIQAAAWAQDDRVTVTRRDLRYDFDPQNRQFFTAREKGIDVALAIGLVDGALRREFDVAIVFTGDTDVLPALELAFHKTTPSLEIACWQGFRPLWFPEFQRLSPPRQLPYCHFLKEQDFIDCRDYSAANL